MNVIHILLGDDPIWIVFMEWEGRMDLFQLTFEPEMHLEALCWDCTDYHWAKRACCGAFPCASTVPCPAFPCPTFCHIHTVPYCLGKNYTLGRTSPVEVLFHSAFLCKASEAFCQCAICRPAPATDGSGVRWCPACSMCHFQEQQLVLSMADFAPFEPIAGLHQSQGCSLCPSPASALRLCRN